MIISNNLIAIFTFSTIFTILTSFITYFWVPISKLINMLVFLWFYMRSESLKLFLIIFFWINFLTILNFDFLLKSIRILENNIFMLIINNLFLYFTLLFLFFNKQSLTFKRINQLIVLFWRIKIFELF